MQSENLQIFMCHHWVNLTNNSEISGPLHNSKKVTWYSRQQRIALEARVFTAELRKGFFPWKQAHSIIIESETRKKKEPVQEDGEEPAQIICSDSTDFRDEQLAFLRSKCFRCSKNIVDENGRKSHKSTRKGDHLEQCEKCHNHCGPNESSTHHVLQDAIEAMYGKRYSEDSKEHLE
ncbi:hypothetical protein DsansV1_C21g0167581 [Dioscorea sansibarensis]